MLTSLDPLCLTLQLTVDGLARVLCMSHASACSAPRDRQVEHVKHHVIGLVEAGNNNCSSGAAMRRKGSRERRKIKSPILKYNKWDRPSTDFAESPITGRSNPPPPQFDQLPPPQPPPYVSELSDIRRMLRSFMVKINEGDRRNRVNLEWRIVAMALDKMFFYIYVTMVTVTLLTVFPWTTAMWSK